AGDQLVWGLEGKSPHTGDAVAWRADSTGLSELAAAELAHELNTLPASVDTTLGLYVVPALTGLGAPWWEDSARGVRCAL
ncbi:carbohydrate kinase, partial [Klebsiella pneumoniae]